MRRALTKAGLAMALASMAVLGPATTASAATVSDVDHFLLVEKAWSGGWLVHTKGEVYWYRNSNFTNVVGKLCEDAPKRVGYYTKLTYTALDGTKRVKKRSASGLSEGECAHFNWSFYTRRSIAISLCNTNGFMDDTCDRTGRYGEGD